MAQLAIKGHPERGKEVIEILEMLGGYNANNHYGNHCDKVYYINENGYIDCDFIFRIEQHAEFIIFSLEEFLEKFPYKVGDKVNYVKYNDEYPDTYIIQRMRWTGVTIEYLLDSSGFSALTKDLKPYKEETTEERKSINLNELEQQLDEASVKETTESLNKQLDGEPQPKAPILSNRYDYAEGKCGYVIPDGYEFDSIKQGFQTEIILRPIKSQYPKTYVECAKILESSSTVYIDGYKAELFEKFQKLLICRDAYWKIAGDEMGLGKPWEPDWKNTNSNKYCIYYVGDEIKKQPMLEVRHFLAFPTKEMRDAFYENFKELIKKCKELL